MRLKDKTAIVVGAGQTPGDSIGNGRATAILFAREGDPGAHSRRGIDRRSVATDQGLTLSSRGDAAACEMAGPTSLCQRLATGGVLRPTAASASWRTRRPPQMQPLPAAAADIAAA
jgi:NAD(P)-dependent dehydrogenase (short-subunit alcohol dehydrogenase family)